MPEDYQAILDGLGVDTTSSNEPAPTTEPTQSSEPATVTPPTQAPEPSADDNKGDDDDDINAGQQVSANNNNNRANEAFAAMRAENNKYKKFMQHIMKGANFQGDEESFMKSLTEASYQRQAQQQGGQVSPEILKRMDSLEAQNQTLLDARNRELFAANLKNMQDTFKLNTKDLEEFLQYAAKEHIDLTIPGTNFNTLYQGLFFDKLMTRRIEEERQKWLEQNTKANNAANPDGKSGKKDPTPTNVNTMAEFDSLLQSIPNSK